MPPSTDDTQRIHAQYRALTGLDVPYSMQLHYMWEQWLAMGWQEPDLACVVRYIKQKIKECKRPKESLLPRNLIQRTDFFAEDLAISRAEARNTCTETPRQRVLAQSGRPEQPPERCKPIRDVIAESKALADLQQWKIENGMV